jgi:hypothetical protein
VSRRKQKLVSILGASYFQPIADLLDRWLSRPKPPRPNKVQSGYFEHAYAAAVILLIVAMFESYVSRLRFAQRPRVPVNTRHALDVLIGLYPKFRQKEALADVYVVRDAIFHNHLWEIEYSWSGSPSMILHNAVMDPAFGDKRFRSRVNLHTRRTKALGLNVVPIRLDKRDVLKVFETTWKALLFLESMDRWQCYVSDQNIRFRGKTRLFSGLRDELAKAL